MFWNIWREGGGNRGLPHPPPRYARVHTYTARIFVTTTTLARSPVLVTFHVSVKFPFQNETNTTTATICIGKREQLLVSYTEENW